MSATHRIADHIIYLLFTASPYATVTLNAGIQVYCHRRMRNVMSHLLTAYCLQFWRSVGGRVLRLAPEKHDALVSRASHLPHVVAATLARSVLDPAEPKAQATLCATGFRDTTRIASGSPEMWRDIALANRTELGLALDEFIGELQGVRALFRDSDPAKLQKFFETAKARRDKWRAGSVSNSQE